MKILSIDEPFPENDCALTIGAFDGIHLGHQKLIRTLQDTKKPTCIFTFTNHPMEVFSPEKKTLFLSSLEQRVSWLEALGADYLLYTTFTKAFTQTTYEEFLSFLKAKTNFSYLALGKGSAFGKEKAGTEKAVKKLETKYQFTSEYIEPALFQGKTISSTEIRKCIQQGDFKTAKDMLGRPYTLQTHAKTSYVLPPNGTYPVLVDGKKSTLTVLDGTFRYSEEKPDASIVFALPTSS